MSIKLKIFIVISILLIFLINASLLDADWNCKKCGKRKMTPFGSYCPSCAAKIAGQKSREFIQKSKPRIKRGTEYLRKKANEYGKTLQKKTHEVGKIIQKNASQYGRTLQKKAHELGKSIRKKSVPYINEMKARLGRTYETLKNSKALNNLERWSKKFGHSVANKAADFIREMDIKERWFAAVATSKQYIYNRLESLNNRYGKSFVIATAKLYSQYGDQFADVVYDHISPYYPKIFRYLPEDMKRNKAILGLGAIYALKYHKREIGRSIVNTTCHTLFNEVQFGTPDGDGMSINEFAKGYINNYAPFLKGTEFEQAPAEVFTYALITQDFGEVVNSMELVRSDGSGSFVSMAAVLTNSNPTQMDRIERTFRVVGAYEDLKGSIDDPVKMSKNLKEFSIALKECQRAAA